MRKNRCAAGTENTTVRGSLRPTIAHLRNAAGQLPNPGLQPEQAFDDFVSRKTTTLQSLQEKMRQYELQELQRIQVFFNSEYVFVAHEIRFCYIWSFKS